MQQGDPLAPMLFSVGMHLVAEKLLAHPELRAILFLDDAIIRGKSALVLQTFRLLRAELATIGLNVHLRKCELYATEGHAEARSFDGIPVIDDPDQWTYLGSPLCEKSMHAVKSAADRISQATQAISRLADKYPKQGFQLLCLTTGAC